MRPVFAAPIVLFAATFFAAPAPPANRTISRTPPFTPFSSSIKAKAGRSAMTGLIWHTIDAGKVWERVPSGVRASLRSVCFLNPYFGWIAGREELVDGGSVGVLLCTQDGGVTWKRVLANTLPGLNTVRFADDKTGYLLGDGSDQYPSGLFVTNDGGRRLAAGAGARVPSWLAGDFSDGKGGALAGAWNRLGTVRNGQAYTVDMDSLGGRNLCGVQLHGKTGVAVGQGGLVLTTNAAGSSWNFAELGLPKNVAYDWDFRAVHGAGKQSWVVGHPGRWCCTAATTAPIGKFSIPVNRCRSTPSISPTSNTAGRSASWGRCWPRPTAARVGKCNTAAVTLGGPVRSRSRRWNAARYHRRRRRSGRLSHGLLRVTSADPAEAAPAQSADTMRYCMAVRQAAARRRQYSGNSPSLRTSLTPTATTCSRRGTNCMPATPPSRCCDNWYWLCVFWRPDVVVTDDASAGVADALVVERFARPSKPQPILRCFPNKYPLWG